MEPQAVIFEDEGGIRSVLKGMLERHGFSVSEAHLCNVAPADASACDLRCCPACNGPGLAVIAVQGRRSCSGVALAGKLISRQRPFRIILLTTSPTDLWRERDQRGFAKLPKNACLLLAKPFTFSGFSGAVRTVLGTRPLGTTP